MSQTEPDAADVFFASYLLPLRLANRRARIDYLDRDGSWAGIATRTGGVARVDAAAVTAASRLVELEDHWRLHHEDRLLRLLPALQALAARIVGTEAEVSTGSEPSVPDFIYPMF